MLPIYVPKGHKIGIGVPSGQYEPGGQNPLTIFWLSNFRCDRNGKREQLLFPETLRQLRICAEQSPVPDPCKYHNDFSASFGREKNCESYKQVAAAHKKFTHLKASGYACEAAVQQIDSQKKTRQDN